MTYSISEDAHAVLLPAFAGTRLSDSVKAVLSNGGCSILAGESRSEEVALDALKAGCNLLLVGDAGDQLQRIAGANVEAVHGGILNTEGLANSAARVRRLAEKYNRPTVR